MKRDVISLILVITLGVPFPANASCLPDTSGPCLDTDDTSSSANRDRSFFALSAVILAGIGILIYKRKNNAREEKNAITSIQASRLTPTLQTNANSGSVFGISYKIAF